MESERNVTRTRAFHTDASPFIPSKEEYDTHVSTKLVQDDLYYSMKNRPRGRLIVFNHESYDVVDGVGSTKREGTIKDIKKLENTFKNLGFTYDLQQDKTYAEIIRYCKRVANMKELQNYDCLAVAILTHGGSGDFVYAKDNVPYNIKEVVQEFLADKCPYLSNKPKLFFIQACKGHMEQKRIFMRTMTDSSPESPVIYTIPAHSDVLISFATLEGFIALRHPDWGSPYVDNLCKQLEQYGKEKNILDILTRVHHTLAVGKFKYDVGIDGPSVNITIQPSFLCYLNRFVVFKD
ncbi:hypothetical protein C0J52_02705 [Blattella germanica]|nr:hypothetical protein C0J52_02705 [Blattella germanica]